MSEQLIKRICVFCGSSLGTREIYGQQAQQLGQAFVARGIELVYGGGGIGVMGAVAGAVINGGGKVIGVMPYALATKERALTNENSHTELRVVNTMHERKALMAELSDAFIALPGGFGTFDELFEIITWGQLGIHQKPIGLLNIDGYFDPLLAMIDRAVSDGFVQPQYRGLFVISDSISELLTQIHDYQPLKSIVQWIEMSET
ncbi:MAG: TIGR00730 family Rossman fold protein [Acidobacteriota bacterium]